MSMVSDEIVVAALCMFIKSTLLSAAAAEEPMAERMLFKQTFRMCVHILGQLYQDI